MKLRNRLWMMISFLFVLLCFGLYVLIVQSYEGRMLAGKENISITQGLSIAERLGGAYPRFPERTQSYLAAYSERLKARLLILSGDGAVQFDSFNQINPGAKLDIAVIKHLGQKATSVFSQTHSYGYVQHTLIPLDPDKPLGGYLLMIEDVNMVYEDIRSFQNWILILMAITVVIAFFICYWIASWFTKPIHDMIEEIERISQHQRSFTYQYRRKDEIRDLVEAIRAMVNQLNLYEMRQRQFVSASSHELKTPLATMQMITENLPFVREDRGTHQEFVHDLTLQIDRMKEMVDQLLQINRMWDQPIIRRLVSAEEIKQHIDEQFQHLAEGKGVTIHYDLDPLTLPVDPNLFLLAIDNLVSNAIRYSPEGKSVNIRLKRLDKQKVIFSICDQGIGIEKKALPYIFDPFFRSQEAVEWNQEGSGLGLTIVKQMVDRHNGQIKVESTRGKGTCFHLVL
jgi:signal transduction histidine kinase